MKIAEAQQDLRRAYVGGGPGALVSSLVWLAAALMATNKGIGPAFATLFFGGFTIYPLGTLLSRVAFGRAKESADNPMGMLALEGTIAMIGCLFAAWLLLRYDPGLVFPIAAIAVGTHYFVFKTAYGDRRYWIAAAILTAIGAIEIFRPGIIPGGPIFAFFSVEFLFAIWFILQPDRSL